LRTPTRWKTSCHSRSERTASSSPTARWRRDCSAASTTWTTGPAGCGRPTPLFGTENLRRVAPLLETLRQVADAHDVKPAQVALAWLLSQPQVVVIPGASSVEQLEFNVAAADLELDAPSRAALTEAARAFTPISAARTLIDGVREKFGI